MTKTKKLVETKDLMFVWKLILKNMAVLLFLPILAYGVGYVYTYRLSDVYGSKVQILIKSDDTYDYQDQIYKGLGAYGAYMDIQNQMRILQSKDFIGEVVDKMDVATSYSIKGRLKKKEVFETLPFKVESEVLSKSLYEVPMDIEVVDLKSFKMSYMNGGIEKVITHPFDSLFINEDIKIRLNKQYEFNQGNIVGIQGSKYEIINHSRENLISRYSSRIGVSNVEYTSILEITVLDDLQYRGKRFLDTLTAVYVNYSTRAQLEVNKNTLENIEKQIDTVSKFIQDKEGELLNYKDKNAILHLSKEEEVYFSNYVLFTKNKRELKAKLTSLGSLEEYVFNITDDHLLPPAFSELKEDFYLNKTMQKVYELQITLKSRENTHLQGSTNVKNLKKEIAVLKKDILIYIDNLRSDILSKISDVDDLIGLNKSNVKKIPVSEQGISNIKRDLDVNNKMYLFLLEKKTNTLIARAGIIPQVRLVDSASALGVVQPDKSKLMRLFVLGGFVLALFVAVVRSLFFERIENVDELSAATDLAIMGGLPFVKEVESKLIVTQKPKAQITESFRTLRTNIAYLGESSNEGRAKLVLVSSFFPGEGKTFTASNTAALMAMSDKKVLIMDFDLHKPKIHKTFDLKNTKGVSSYLIGKDSLEDVIVKNVRPNLDVVSAGPIPPNPSELIMKKEMKTLFEKVSEHYDFILVDTPPFGLLNDAVELIKFVDAFLVVLNTKVLRRKGLYTVEEILSKNKNLSLGLVLNGIKKTKFQYYYSKYTYKYNYNYGYNYGYGYGDSYSDYVDEE